MITGVKIKKKDNNCWFDNCDKKKKVKKDLPDEKYHVVDFSYSQGKT